MDIKEELNENVQPQKQPRKKKRKHKYSVVRAKSNGKAIRCTFCDRKFFKLKQLRFHIKQIHFSEASEAENNTFNKTGTLNQ